MPLDPRSTNPDGSEASPVWRRHFPVDTDLDENRSRREFLGGAVVAGGAMTCGQIVLHQLTDAQLDTMSHISPPAKAEAVATAPRETTTARAVDPPSPQVPTPPGSTLVLEKSFDEMSVGETLLFHYPNHKSPCLLIKLSQERFVAYAQKCTHLACPVIPAIETSEFHCPCHHGKFALETGEPIAGPPRSALPKVNVQLDSHGTLTVIGWA